MTAVRRIGGLGSDIGWSLLAAIGSVGLGVAALAVATHDLGFKVFGRFVVAEAIAGLAQTINYAISTAVVRRAAREFDRADTALQREIVDIRNVGLVLGSVLPAIGVAVAPLLGLLLGLHGRELLAFVATQALLSATAAIVLTTMSEEGVAIGRRRFRRLALCDIAGGVLGLALIVGLAPVMGIVGLGVARLAGAALDRGALRHLTRREARWLTVPVRRPSGAATRALLGLSTPLLAVTMAAQAVVLTDTLVVGGMVGAAAVGAYRIGAVLPTQAVALLFRGYDVVLPQLAKAREGADSLAATRLLTNVACFIGGSGLTVLAWEAASVVHVLGGHYSHVAVQVLPIFAAIWLINLAIHGYVVLLVAHDDQMVLTRLVVAETIGNVIVTVPAVALFGATGAAVATLVAVAVSNGIVLPHILSRRFGISAAQVIGHGIAASVFGAAIASVAAAIVLGLSDYPRLVAALCLTAVFASAAGLAVLRSDGRRQLRELFSSHLAVPALTTHPSEV